MVDGAQPRDVDVYILVFFTTMALDTAYTECPQTLFSFFFSLLGLLFPCLFCPRRYFSNLIWGLLCVMWGVGGGVVLDGLLAFALTPSLVGAAAPC